jgi:hypothetical protein
MRKALVTFALLLLGAAYLAGYWPQREQVRAAQQSAAQAQQQLAGVQAVARLCRLENDLLALIAQTESQNYGNARGLSQAFFDNLRREADRDPHAAYKPDLENILGQRDAITAALARNDTASATPLRQILAQMQQVMEKAAAQAGV